MSALMLFNQPPRKVFFGWFKVVDIEENYSFFTNNDEQTDLDAWEFKLEIAQDKLEFFQMTKEPLNFEVTLNDVVATLSNYDDENVPPEPSPAPIWSAFENEGVLLRVRVAYPENVDEDNRPYLVILKSGAGFSPPPLNYNFQIRVLIKDVVNNLDIINFYVEINSNFTKVAIADLGSQKLKTKKLDGDFFSVIASE